MDTIENTTNHEDYIYKMYDSSLQSQKAQLEADHLQNQENLEAQKQAAQKEADAALARTYVEAAKAQKAQQEAHNAYGLTSGAMAQARLAQDNQLQADLTTIRAAQQEADAQIERQRSILAQQFMSAITQAQANNDLEKAQALYEAAQKAEAELLTQKKEAAGLMAGAGDFSLYQALYGLTDAQAAALKKRYNGSAGGYTPVVDAGDETTEVDTPLSGVQSIGATIKENLSNVGDRFLEMLGIGGTKYSTDRESVRQLYRQQKANGTPQWELDELLERAIAAGLDAHDAHNIRDERL